VGAYETYLGSCLVRLFVVNRVKRVRSTVLSRYIDCLFHVINETKESECRLILLDK
jgi:hypothetical protein